MKSSLKWVAAGVVLGLLGLLVWHFLWEPRARLAGYRNVSRLLCGRFAAEAVAKSLTLATPAGTPRLVVVSPIADGLMAEAALARDRASSQGRVDNSAIEQRYIADVLGILKKEAPELLALCEKLTPVYASCEGLSKEPALFRSCVEEKQKPVVTEIANWLFRNVPK